MRSIFVDILRKTVHGLARLTIWRYRPGIVGVTGSVGKTSTKFAIATVLARGRRVRASSGNLNNDLGLPLTILGDWTPEELALVSRDTPPGAQPFRKIVFWLKVIFQSAWNVVMRSKTYPDILVLEYGADRPGDIKRLLKIARPNVSVITAVGEYPVHVEFYAGPEELAREKGRLIECLPVGGFAVMNHDDEMVMNLEPRTRARTATFGFEKGAEMRIVRFENRVVDGIPMGIAFKLESNGSSVPVFIPGALGRAQAYAAAAAASIGLIFGVNLVKIAEALGNYHPADSRMQLLAGIKQTMLIDDSYNASPLSMHAALDTLRDLPAKRRIAVLGDMLEIGKYTIEAHERMGHLAAQSADLLFTVGPRAKFIVEAARADGMKSANIQSFDAADDAGKPLQAAMRKGDLVLIKGSHAMQLYKVIEEVKEIPTASSSNG